jgi:predicted nucleic acid-binding protein
MGLILDSSAVIAGERKGQSAADLLAAIRASLGPEAIALSTVSVIELEHGIWRAKDAAQAANRQKFFDDLFAAIPTCPLTFSPTFSQVFGCDDVAQALLPAGVPPGPGTHADA